MTAGSLKRKVDPADESQPQDSDVSLQNFLNQHHPADQSTLHHHNRQPSTFFETRQPVASLPHTILPKKVVIDLTEDESSDLHDDLLLSRQLQAQFDTEIALPVPGSPSKKQKMTLPSFDPYSLSAPHGEASPSTVSMAFDPFSISAESANLAYQSTSLDEEMARALQAHIDAQDANKLDEARYRIAEASSSAAQDSTLTLDSQTIHELAESVYKRRCPGCAAALTHDLNDLIRVKKRALMEEKTITGTMSCRFCHHAICAGCGKLPAPTQMGLRNDRFQEYMVGWHCDNSRRVVLLILLCIPAHGKSASRKPSRPYPAPRNGIGRFGHKHLAGVGYGRDDHSFVGQHASFKSSEQEDLELLPVLVALLEAIPNWHKETTFDQVPLEAFLSAIFRRSTILEQIAGLLRNDSIPDMAQRSPIYHTLITFLTALANHAATAAVLFRPRHLYPEKHQLLAITTAFETIPQNGVCEETTSSLAQLLEPQASQAKGFLERARKDMSALLEDRELQDAVQICERFVDLAEFIANNSNSSIPVEKPTSGKGKCKATDDMKTWYADNCVTEVEDTLMLEHHYWHREANKIVNSSRGRMKKLLMELTSLRSSLPPGIYVKYASSRIDVMKFLIIGPMGTPYENGVFEFDLLCPADYPASPPKVQFKTTGEGRAHFNPNLYPCGKVCLSLLGTWSGEPWRADQSTLLQVFVSIQSMILCDEPWTNEPGREHHRRSQQSLNYNHVIRRLTTQYSLIPWAIVLQKADKGEDMLWSNIIEKHFEQNVDRILYTTARWAQDSKPPSKVTTRSSFSSLIATVSKVSKLIPSLQSKSVSPKKTASQEQSPASMLKPTLPSQQPKQESYEVGSPIPYKQGLPPLIHHLPYPFNQFEKSSKGHSSHLQPSVATHMPFASPTHVSNSSYFINNMNAASKWPSYHAHPMPIPMPMPMPYASFQTSTPSSKPFVTATLLPNGHLEIKPAWHAQPGTLQDFYSHKWIVGQDGSSLTTLSPANLLIIPKTVKIVGQHEHITAKMADTSKENVKPGNAGVHTEQETSASSSGAITTKAIWVKAINGHNISIENLKVTDFPFNPIYLPVSIGKLLPHILKQKWKKSEVVERISRSSLYVLLSIGPYEAAVLDNISNTPPPPGTEPSMAVPWPIMPNHPVEGSHDTSQGAPANDHLIGNEDEGFSDVDDDYEVQLDDMADHEATGGLSAEIVMATGHHPSKSRCSFESLVEQLKSLLANFPQGNTTKEDLDQKYAEHIFEVETEKTKKRLPKSPKPPKDVTPAVF